MNRPIVLVIDGDDEILEALEVVLEHAFRVVPAQTAGEALGMVAVGLDPDAILSSVYLNRMDALALQAELPEFMRSRLVVLAGVPVRGATAAAISSAGMPLVHRPKELNLLEPILLAKVAARRQNAERAA